MEKKIYHVVAMARNRVIGKDNKLPWHFPADLKHFKQLTTGSTVIMGRKTFESIGKPLPNRENFVLSRRIASPSNVLVEGPQACGFPAKASGNDKRHLYFFTSFEEAVKKIKTKEAYVIGGAELYRQTIDNVDGIYLTRIDADYQGDAYYPEIPDKFDEVDIEGLQENPKVDIIFYERK